jgi:hypothetical protein
MKHSVAAANVEDTVSNTRRRRDCSASLEAPDLRLRSDIDSDNDPIHIGDVIRDKYTAFIDGWRRDDGSAGRKLPCLLPCLLIDDMQDAIIAGNVDKSAGDGRGCVNRAAGIESPTLLA